MNEGVHGFPERLRERLKSPEARIAVTGAGGFVGRTLCAMLGDKAAPLTHQEVDITDAEGVRRALKDPHLVALVNAAAHADVDFCENNPEEARRVNVLGPALLARECAHRGLPFVHISTDYVFPGDRREVFRENDPRRPVNVYGRTKAEGEEKVLENNPRSIIARTAWVYGRGGRGFGSRVGIRLAAGEHVTSIHDRHGHPTYVRDLAWRIIELLDCGKGGIFHAVNGGPTSWYAFSKRFAMRLGLDSSAVEPVSRHDLPPAAPRPHHIALSQAAVTALGLSPLRSWEHAQDAFIRELVAAGGRVE